MYKKKIPVLGQTKHYFGVVSWLRAVTRQHFGKAHKEQAGAKWSLPANSALTYFGQEQFTHSGALSKGEAPFPVKVVTLGSSTGKSP